MHAFHVNYRNSHATRTRILNAISRCGLDVPYVQDEPANDVHRLSLLLELNPRQIGQLYRNWYAIADVVDVCAGAPTEDMMEFAECWDAAKRPPASASAVVDSRRVSVA